MPRPDLRLPKVVLIHGFLGVGKTTFAKNLAAELSAVRFTHDELMVILYGRDPPAEEFPELKARVDMLISILWKRCVEAGASVVLDLNFWTREFRDETREYLKNKAISSHLLSLTCSEQTARGRIRDRNTKNSEQLFISDDTFTFLQTKFEPLDADEDRIEVDTEARIDIPAIIRQLK